MGELRGIDADYVNWRTVMGRKVLQLVFEIDIARQQEVLTMLGTPTPGESRWCAIAPLKAKPLVQAEGGSPKKSWGEYNRSQQAAILCDDPIFWAYFGTEGKMEATYLLKKHLRIESRKELDRPENHTRWDEFVALYNMKRPK